MQMKREIDKETAFIHAEISTAFGNCFGSDVNLSTGVIRICVYLHNEYNKYIN